MRYLLKWYAYQQQNNWQHSNVSRLTLFGFHLKASVIQLFLSEAQRQMTLSEPLLFLLSFCYHSLSLSALFPGQFFYFFISSSSRVVLGGPVLPETPGTSPLSVFSPFPFRLLSLNALPPSAELSLVLPLSQSLSIPPTSERQKWEAILNQAQYSSFPLYGSVSI